jgi:hypothetical protein
VNTNGENWLNFFIDLAIVGYAIWIFHSMRNVPIHLDFKGRHLTGVADPINSRKEEQVPLAHTIYIGGKFIGTLTCEKQGWVLDRPADLELIEALGEYLHAWYE